MCKGRSGRIVMVVSPLTALMIDQRNKFMPRGISTEFVGASQVDKMAISSVMKGEVQLIYISPECLITNKMYRRMLQSNVYQLPSLSMKFTVSNFGKNTCKTYSNHIVNPLI